MDQSLQKLERGGGSLVLLVVVLVFAPSLFGAFVWDDHSLIVDNANIRNPSSLYELVSTPFWAQLQTDGVATSPLYSWLHRPLIKVVYHFGLQLGDASPFAFHLLLLALHLGCTYLVFDLIRAWLGSRTFASTLTALVLATVFAIHPTRAENVAWISGITDVAMTFFLLVGLRVFRGDPTAGRLAVGALAVALAGWSKETAVLAPALVFLQAIATGVDRRTLMRTTAAASLGAAVVAISFVLAVGKTANAQGLTSREGLVRRVLASLGWFGARVIWPAPATVYPGAFVGGPNGFRPSSLWSVFAGAGLLSAGLGLSAWSWKRQVPPRVLLPLGLVFMPLLPVLNFFPRSTTALIADRFLYLPLIGALLLVSRPLLRAFSEERIGRTLGLLVSGIAVLASANETLSSTARFVDDLTLFEHEARVQPESLEANQALIDTLRHAHRLPEAREVALRALARAHARRDAEAEIKLALDYLRTEAQILPEFEQERLVQLSEVYTGIEARHEIAISDGRVRFHMRLVGETARNVRADPAKFGLPRAMVRMRIGALEDAQRQLEALVANEPRMVPAWEMLGICRARRGDFLGAIETLDQSLRRFPGQRSLVEARDLVLSTEEIARRELADPAMRTVRDANVQLMLGSPGAARRLLLPVLREHPDLLEATVLLAQVEEADGLPVRALAVLDAALARTPGNPILLSVRNWVQERMRNPSTPGGAPGSPH